MIWNQRGYQYKYDYENRIVEILDDSNNTVAEFTYDALGRRIEKKDLVDANNTRRYYYNYNWQVLCDCNQSGQLWRSYVYGNYIDEVLYKSGDGGTIFYVHDHLYSPVALVQAFGYVVERYEYDAYGHCTIMNSSYSPLSESQLKNPYLFTGRRPDYLDSGSLKIQYNRNRYYDYYSGRWLTHDPLGITPNAQMPNEFGLIGQYKEGMNVYEYVGSSPVLQSDRWGLYWMPAPGTRPWAPTPTRPKCGICGPDVTGPLSRFKDQLTRDFDSWPWWKKHSHCSGMCALDGWELDTIKTPDQYPGCATCDCKETVSVHGKCYSQHAVNYYMWGLMNSLCHGIFAPAEAEIGLLWPLISGDRSCKREWAKAGL